MFKNIDVTLTHLQWEQCHWDTYTLNRPDAMLKQSHDPPQLGGSATWMTGRSEESFSHQEKHFPPYRPTITCYLDNSLKIK